jgi:hypothetical protein
MQPARISHPSDNAIDDPQHTVAVKKESKFAKLPAELFKRILDDGKRDDLVML